MMSLIATGSSQWGAKAAEVEAGAGGVAVLAPLLAEVAGVAVRALVDGDRALVGDRPTMAGVGKGCGWRARQAAWRQAGVQ